MLQWDDLRFFLAVARTRTLSAAAKSLSVDGTTVGRRIDRLQRYLDPGQQLEAQVAVEPGDPGAAALGAGIRKPQPLVLPTSWLWSKRLCGPYSATQ